MRRVSTSLPYGAAGRAKRGDPKPEKGAGFRALGGGDPRAESNGSDWVLFALSGLGPRSSPPFVNALPSG